MTTFPRNLQPNWIDAAEAPQRPDIAQRFQSGADSNLRLSSIPVDGAIVCEWIVSTKQFKDFMDFWAVVELSTSFDLPVNFYPLTCDPALVALLESHSPTGLWRFTEKYKHEFLRTDCYRISATFRGAIL